MPTSDDTAPVFGVAPAEVLDDFREAVSEAASRAMRDARERADVRTGARPAFGIDGLDVELAVGVAWSDEGKVRISFEPAPGAVSRLRFRVQALPVTAVTGSYIAIVPVYDPEGRFGRRELEVVLRDENNSPVSYAPLTVRISRSDREGGQVANYDMRADKSGTARFVVNTVDRTITLSDETTYPLPAKSAASWTFVVRCDDPVAESDELEIHAQRRRRSGR